jgi:gluconate 2-dehydrogenase gamma chain
MSEPEDDASLSPSRRRFFKSLSLIPVAVTLSSSAEPSGAETAAAAAEKPYKPVFFNADEWTFLVAICDRLIPADEVGPGAVDLGVPEFLDRHMQTPYASGAIWYMQGPFLEAAPEFGYQGRLPLREILRVGIAEMEASGLAAIQFWIFVLATPITLIGLYFTLSGGPELPTIIGSLGLLLGAILFFVVIWRARNAN